ncbi:hypothetical protein B0H16DRAFT_1777542 [Mycena metata]|uniref:Uncharacterized protein n=1 Tax=Mycena metata TaxID=1033252 RepID=A0AAD7HVD1_9AGAR|nr:hypothetical protein B0H16DRAFT_1777542 [Mycena metata]
MKILKRHNVHDNDPNKPVLPLPSNATAIRTPSEAVPALPATCDPEGNQRVGLTERSTLLLNGGIYAGVQAARAWMRAYLNMQHLPPQPPRSELPSLLAILFTEPGQMPIHRGYVTDAEDVPVGFRDTSVPSSSVLLCGPVSDGRYRPMNRPGFNSVIPPGVLKHTESQLHSAQRAKLEYEIVTGKQISRLQIKLADTKMRLQAAQNSFNDLEKQTNRALCDAVIKHQKLQCLDTMQKDFSCSICWEIINSPDVHRVTEVPVANYELETAVEALMKADIFKRGPVVKRLPHDYKKYFPEINVDRTSRPSRIGPHRYTHQPRRVRIDPRFRQPHLNSPAYRPRRNPGSENEWDTSIWGSNTNTR